MTTTDIIARLNAGSGAIIDATTGEDIRSGYAVATNIHLRVPEYFRGYFLPSVEQFVKSARGLYPVLGSWRAREFREYAVTDVYDDRETALYMARRNGEEAIFDLANGVEIPTN